ncbi:MAG: ABC transporter permease, partial [Bacillota bacterium]
MFIRLGFLNVSRNLARSLMAIISMAVAAVFFTTTISLTGGYPKDGYRMYSQMIGGEVAAYAAKFTGALPTENHAIPWKLVTPVPEATTDLPVFRPEIFAEGFLSMGGSGISTFSPQDIQRIASQPGVQGAYPYYLMPGRVEAWNGPGVFYSAPLRGRDLAVEDPEIARFLVEGRYFSVEDYSKPVAIISRYQMAPEGVKSAELGDWIRIKIPTITMRDGLPIYNYQQFIERELEVIGILELPTRIVSWINEFGLWEQEQIYWHTSEIQLPLGTWQTLYRHAGGSDYQPVQVSVNVPDMSTLENRVSELNQSFPEFSFISIPNQAQTAWSKQLIERTYRAPKGLLQYPEPWQHSALALDLRGLLLSLLYLIAGIIVAGNMLRSVRERKDEMGVLKAIGARRVDVVVMVLTEAALISS